MYEIKRMIEAKGLGVHKDRWTHTSSGMVVTGAHVSDDLLAPSNKHHVKLRDKLKTLDATSDAAERLTLVDSLVGMTSNALSTYPVGTELHERAMKRRQWLHGERRDLQRKIEEDFTRQKDSKIIEISAELPW
jgi:hypothetical protein